MWEDYCIAAGLRTGDVTTEAFEEARRAFYGGMLDMFAALHQVSELGEKAADETLARWQEEFTAYATDLSRKLDPKK